MKIGRVALVLTLLAGLSQTAPSAGAAPGDRLAFVTGDDRLVVANRDGSGVRWLARNVSRASWSPRGDRLAYARLSELRVVNPASGQDYEVWRLPTGPAGCQVIACAGVTTNVAHPAWSPTDERIAFVAGAGPLAMVGWGLGGAVLRTKIFIISSDGSGLTPLTATHSGEMDPAWSPDGGRIAFNSFVDGAFTVMVATPGSSTLPEVVSPLGIVAGAPVWSPGGDRIAFLGTSAEEAVPYDCYLYVMNADGSETRQLAHMPVCADTKPSWSPDGRWLTYAAAGLNVLNSGVHVVAADGSSRRQLTSGYDYGSAWSPDGGSIAFARFAQGQDGVYLVGTDGGWSQRIVESPVGRPFWAP
ncbi:MAG TPA: hypothetical protein VNE62_08315 [Actinomycetota bacterium]|nr:hypothetical protein [Actinomycetota bacterium]